MPRIIKVKDTPLKYKYLWIENILDRKILFNPFGGRLVVVGQKVWKIVSHCDGLTSISKIAKLENIPLRKTMFSVKKLADQSILSIKNYVSTLNPKEKEKIFRVWIHVTNNCNLACDYCYIKKDGMTMNKRAAWKTIKSLNNSVLKHSDSFNAIRYVLSGGEPLTNFSVVEEILEYSKLFSERTGIKRRVSLLTNGTIFSSQIASTLKKYNVGISISLDGLGKTNSHRVFPDGAPSVNSVLKNIDQFLKLGIRPYILTTVTLENLKGLISLTHYLMEKELGFRYSLLTDLETGKNISNYSSRVIDELNKCFDLIEKMMVKSSSKQWLNINFQTIPLLGRCTRACGIGHNFVAVSHDGKIHLCHTDINRKKPISNINSKDIIQDLWNQESFPELRIYKGVQDYEECRECYWKFQCGGSCPRFTKVATGRLNTRSPYCDIIRTMIPRVLRIRALNLIRKEVKKSGSIRT